MRRLTVPLAAAALLLLPALAEAHGIGGRRDLPVPTWLFAWAAAAVLFVSFVGLGALWRSARLARATEKRLGRVPAWLEIPIGAIGVALLGLVLVSGFFGVQSVPDNFAPTAIFVGLWLGVAFSSLLVGDLYAALNPLRALGRATGWIAGRLAGGRLPAPLEFPARVGRWPAAIGLFAFAWVELAWWPGDSDPSHLAIVVTLFCLFHAIGMSLYGTDRWINRADPFAVWFSWIATLAPLRWERGTVYLRAPGVGAAKRRARTGDAAVVVVAIASTTWDGLAGGTLAATLGDWASSLSSGGPLSPEWANILLQTIGLLLLVGAVTALIFAGTRGMLTKQMQGKAPRVRHLVDDFAPALVPIAVAYAVGHYLSLLAFEGQALAPLLANPLGDELAPGDGGWLGTAGWTVNYTWLTANTIWYLQVAALLTGHVMSLVLSHDRALERFPKRWAARSQRAMLVVAVAFTCTGLWLLS